MARRRPRLDQIDLLDWAEVDEARRELERAEAARSEASRRYRLAWPGSKQDRLYAFQRATDAAIAAAAVLQSAMRRARS